ncbi:substrate-binding domain-containing protein [Streptomyces sp. NBC_00510]
MRRRGRVRGAVASAAAVLLVSLGTAPPAHAAAGAPVAGAGSTWANGPLDQWRYTAGRSGLGIVGYSGTGSADGRNQFRNGTVDYAVSDLPYGLTEGGVTDRPPARPFAYVPAVVGGIGFHYNVQVDGERITNLRLSPATVAGIFTRGITRWDDPAIRADNPGTRLPDVPVVPVVRADASGTTAALTQWLADRQPAVWGAYCGAAGRGAGCGATSLFPTVPGDVAVAGSNGVTGYVAGHAGNGAITYAESSYAQIARTVMARLLNRAGYYTSPTQGGVTVGLATTASDPSGTRQARRRLHRPGPADVSPADRRLPDRPDGDRSTLLDGQGADARLVRLARAVRAGRVGAPGQLRPSAEPGRQGPEHRGRHSRFHVRRRRRLGLRRLGRRGPAERSATAGVRPAGRPLVREHGPGRARAVDHDDRGTRGAGDLHRGQPARRAAGSGARRVG